MLSRILRTAAMVYLFIGAGLMTMAKAVERPGGLTGCSCPCSCPSRTASGSAPEPAPLAPGDLAPLAMLDA